MNTENEERRALIVKFVAGLNMLLDKAATYEVYKSCGGQVDATCAFIEIWNNSKHPLSHAWGLFVEDKKLRDERLTEEERKARLVEAFIENWRNWMNENPNHVVTHEDLTWWCDVTGRLGIGEHIWQQVLIHRLNTDYDGWLEHIKGLKAKNAIPYDLQPKEYAALILSLYELIEFGCLPPGHPVWVSLGVNNYGEFKAINPILDTVILANTKHFNRIMRAFLTTAKRAYQRQGKSDKLAYVSEYTGIEPVTEDKIEYLSDDDRLSQFCELNGIEMDKLTDGDVNRVKELLRALDDYDFASKQGVSLSAYYGDKANSEKTQRQRLFKKLRNMRDKVK